MQLGLVGSEPGDGALVADLFDTMHATFADFTNTFRVLASLDPAAADGDADDAAVAERLQSHLYSTAEVAEGITVPYPEDQLRMLVRWLPVVAVGHTRCHG